MLPGCAQVVVVERSENAVTLRKEPLVTRHAAPRSTPEGSTCQVLEFRLVRAFGGHTGMEEKPELSAMSALERSGSGGRVRSVKTFAPHGARRRSGT
ncbi:hypothetical protein BH24PSE2_BH24PSE2_03510 [soil metagenome]